MKIHKDLTVWKQSIVLAAQVYRMTSTFPKQEMYGLAQQMRRAAVSVGSNISEGAARGSKKEFVRYLHMAAGSLSELDTQLEISEAVGIGETKPKQQVRETLYEVASLLGGLIRSQRQQVRNGISS